MVGTKRIAEVKPQVRLGWINQMTSGFVADDTIVYNFGELSTELLGRGDIHSVGLKRVVLKDLSLGWAVTVEVKSKVSFQSLENSISSLFCRKTN